MKKKYFLLTVFIVFTNQISSFGDVGCSTNPNQIREMIYTKRLPNDINGYQNFTDPIIYNSTDFPEACPQYDQSTSIVSTTPCYVNGVTNGYRLVSYTPIDCPIDEKIFILYFPLVILAVYIVTNEK